MQRGNEGQLFPSIGAEASWLRHNIAAAQAEWGQQAVQLMTSGLPEYGKDLLPIHSATIVQQSVAWTEKPVGIIVYDRAAGNF